MKVINQGFATGFKTNLKSSGKIRFLKTSRDQVLYGTDRDLNLVFSKTPGREVEVSTLGVFRILNDNINYNFCREYYSRI